MNKIFTLKSFVAGLVALSSFSVSAQTMQASIRVGSTPKTVDIYLKPSETFAQRDESMTMVLAVPENTNTAPTLGSSGVSSNSKGLVSGIAGLQPSFLENNLGSTSREVVVSKQTVNEKPYYIYTFIFAGTANDKHNWTADVEQKLFSIQFNGEMNPADVLLVNLPNGGAKGTDYWYFQSNTLGDITDYKTPFYKSGKSKQPINGLSPNGSRLSYIGSEQLQTEVIKPTLLDSKVDVKTTPVVYPTVTSGLVSVRLPAGSENATVSIFSNSGKEISVDATKSLNRSINLSAQASGTYYVKILNNEKVISTTKVVLQK